MDDQRSDGEEDETVVDSDQGNGSYLDPPGVFMTNRD